MQELINNIFFKKRPIPLPAEYRPLYKIAQIVLILKNNSRSHKSSLLRLHLFFWAFKNKNNEESLLDFLSQKTNSRIDIWNVEPTLNRALYFALAEKLIEIKLPQGHYILTEKGHKFSELLNKNKSVLQTEKELLKLLKTSITETLVNKVSKQWKKGYA